MYQEKAKSQSLAMASQRPIILDKKNIGTVYMRGGWVKQFLHNEQSVMLLINLVHIYLDTWLLAVIRNGGQPELCFYWCLLCLL
jgi:hypothetical protein